MLLVLQEAPFGWQRDKVGLIFYICVRVCVCVFFFVVA
jgi:hypothetical protein